MTQNPALYRGARAGDAAALGLVAAALIAVAPQAGATNGAATYLGDGSLAERGAGDPGKQGGDIVFQRAKGAFELAQGEPLGRGGAGLLRAGQRIGLGGSVPAAGGPYIALRRADSVVLLDRERLTELARIEGATTDALAVSSGWLVERVREASGDRLQVRRIEATGGGGAASPDSAGLGEARVIARSRRPAQIGRPSLSGATVLYSRAGSRASRLLATRVNGQDRRILFAGRLATFANPAALAGRLAYVRTTRERQEIRLRAIDGRGPGRLVHVRPATSRRDPDHGRGRNRISTRDRPPSLLRDPWTIWTLELAPRAVFATLIRQAEGRPHARIMRFPVG